MQNVECGYDHSSKPIPKLKAPDSHLDGCGSKWCDN